MMENILLIAGGTGGHIWPAIAFGQWVTANHPEVRVSYISGMRQLELDIYKSAGLDPHIISVEGSPLGAPKGSRIRRWKQLVSAVKQTSECFRDDAPDVCVMFGGYISVPALFVSKWHKVKAVVHEQNCVSGRAARLASIMGFPVMSGWKVCAPMIKSEFVHVGVPVRDFKLLDRQDAWRYLGIERECTGPVVSVMAGSLADRRLFDAVSTVAEHPDFIDWTFLCVGGGGVTMDNMIMLPRMWDIAPVFSAADMAITRGGASTLAEMMSMDMPAVVVPWGKATNSHQAANARMFTESGYGAVWTEGESPDKLASVLKKIKKHAENRSLTYATQSNRYNIRTCTNIWSVLEKVAADK